MLQFVTFAARGISWPFVNLYLVSVGFSGTQIGILASVSALVQLILAPLLHTMADRTGSHRRLYVGFLVGNACACVGLVVFAANPLLLSAMILARDLTDLAGAALLSQLTITWLERQQRQIFGKLRAWGSFGWAVATMISGRISAIGGYPLLFIVSVVLNMAVLPLVRVLPTRTHEVHQQGATPSDRPVGLYLLLASLFLFYAGSTAYFAFSFIYFKQDLGASNELLGILSSVAALSEIPAMVLIDRLLRRADIRATLIVGTSGLGLLIFAFSQLSGPALLIPLMMIRGTFYTLQIVSVTLLVSRISQPAHAATNQALAQVTIPGLAVLLTGSLSGWLFDQAGGRVLLQLAALMAALSVVLLLVARRQLKGRETALPGL